MMLNIGQFIAYKIVHTNNIPYTQVNKRIHLFQKLLGNMCLIPNTQEVTLKSCEFVSKLVTW